VTLILSDERLQGLKVESDRSKAPTVFQVLELKNGRYERGSRPEVHHVLKGLDQRVVQVVLKGWKGLDLRHFTEIQRGPIRDALAGISVREVKRVIVVLGMGSVTIEPGCKVDRQEQRTLTNWVGEDLKGVLFQLLSWFPAADLLYLGAGRIWKRLPAEVEALGTRKVDIDLVNGSCVRLSLLVSECFQNFPKYWAIFSRKEARLGVHHARPWGRLRSYDLFDRIPDECILNVQGDLTPLGCKWIGEALRRVLLDLYPGCFPSEHARSTSLRKRSRSMPRVMRRNGEEGEVRPLGEAAPLIDLWSRTGRHLGPRDSAPQVAPNFRRPQSEALRTMGFID
jgi:hypothetical protein